MMLSMPEWADRTTTGTSEFLTFAPPAAQMLEEAYSVHHGHVQIEQHDVNRPAIHGRDLERRDPVHRRADLAEAELARDLAWVVTSALAGASWRARASMPSQSPAVPARSSAKQISANLRAPTAPADPSNGARHGPARRRRGARARRRYPRRSPRRRPRNSRAPGEWSPDRQARREARRRPPAPRNGRHQKQRRGRRRSRPKRPHRPGDTHSARIATVTRRAAVVSVNLMALPARL